MASIARRIVFSIGIIAFIAVCLLLFPGNASAAPDANNDFNEAELLPNNVPALGSLNETDDLSD